MILYDLFIFRQSILLHDSGRYIYIGIDPHDPLYIYIYLYIYHYIYPQKKAWMIPKKEPRNPTKRFRSW